MRHCVSVRGVCLCVCFLLFFKMWFYVIVQAGVDSYGDLTRLLFGTFGEHSINFALAFSSFSFILTYTMIIGKSMPIIARALGVVDGIQLQKQFWVSMFKYLCAVNIRVYTTICFFLSDLTDWYNALVRVQIIFNFCWGYIFLLIYNLKNIQFSVPQIDFLIFLANVVVTYYKLFFVAAYNWF